MTVFNPPVPWSEVEREQLRRLRANGLGLAQTAQLLGRSKASVARQIKTIDLERRVNPSTPPLPREQRRGPLQPLAPGVRTLPPLPSELMDLKR